jgi:hypothetical protein
MSTHRELTGVIGDMEILGRGPSAFHHTNRVRRDGHWVRAATYRCRCIKCGGEVVVTANALSKGKGQCQTCRWTPARLDENKRHLVEKFYPWAKEKARRISRMWFAKGLHPDDVEDAAMYGFIQAVARLDEKPDHVDVESWIFSDMASRARFEAGQNRKKTRRETNILFVGEEFHPHDKDNSPDIKAETNDEVQWSLRFFYPDEAQQVLMTIPEIAAHRGIGHISANNWYRKTITKAIMRRYGGLWSNQR